MNPKVENLIRQIRENLQELEGLMKTTPSAVGDEHASSVLLTPSGKIRGLNSKVLGILRESMEPISSAEIVRRLYDPAYGVSYDAFSRKVIVSVSYLHKSGKRVEMTQGEDGKAEWSIPRTETVASKGWDDTKIHKTKKEVVEHSTT